ncbi:hypothetical protein GCM10023185_29970 [Hymenobacter saemangeumensis]|uniref:ParB-like N-terminal domain-containing protein n=1 Tax=Hymenobacter saemangeumensis TaxID=1084522 RepID=A0ABP8ILF7_9BACT
MAKTITTEPVSKPKTHKAAAQQPATMATGPLDANSHPLAKGDLVRVLHPTSLYTGQTGSIVEIHRPGDNAAMATVDFGSTEKEERRSGFLTRSLEFVARPVAWLDSTGQALGEGDLVKVLPDVSSRLSGKLANVLGNYDADSKSVEILVLATEATTRILPCYLEKQGVPALSEHSLPQPEPKGGVASEYAAPVLSAHALNVLSILDAVGGECPTGNLRTADVAIAELKAAGMVNEGPGTYYLTPTGRLAVPADVKEEAPAAQQEAAAVATPSAELRNIPLSTITVTRNTRKVFDEAALQELAESIKAQGVIQPIVVRPNLARPVGSIHHYELVAGERRYRAAKLAGLDEIPATVRHNMDDRSFLEVQLLENLQRVDVRPADEAQAFAELLGKDFTAEEIALKVGKPVKFVLQRAKLAALAPVWLKALEEERLPLVAAHELARLPAHVQVEAKRMSESWYGGDNVVYDAGRLIDIIRRNVLRQLAQAPFPTEDATLCPVAGSCMTCPKRSGAHQQLFDEPAFAAKDQCLDAKCYASKVEAITERHIARLTQELGKAPLLLACDEKVRQARGAFRTYEFHEQGEKAKNVVQAVHLDGSKAGLVVWGKPYDYAKQAADNPEAEKARLKAEREANIRKNRLKRQVNELLAERLRDAFASDLEDTGLEAGGAPVAHALLNDFLESALLWGRSCTTKGTVAYLVKQYGWQEPTEKDLDNSLRKDDEGGYTASHHRDYLRRQLQAMPRLGDKFLLFFDLKFRDGLDATEPGNQQLHLLKVLPADYQGMAGVEHVAEKMVEERYYSTYRNGKKGGTK